MIATILDYGAARDAKITGTTDPAKLNLIVRILTIISDTNTPAQDAKLAAAQRLLGGR